MKYRDVVFQNAVGLHGRPATYFIQKANGYKSDIRLIKGHDDVNAKSLLGVLHLGISQGTRITLMTTGEDEDAALEELARLMPSTIEEAAKISGIGPVKLQRIVPAMLEAIRLWKLAK